MNHRYLILFIFCLPLLYGCSLATQAFYSSDINQAETYLSQGQNLKAGEIYHRLAQINSPQQNQFRLLAADAFIRAGEIKKASENMLVLNPTMLNPVQQNHLKLLEAQVNLSAGNAEVALSQLIGMQTASLDASTRKLYYKSLAFAYSLTGKPLKSAQALINLDLYIHKPLERKEHYQTILKTLNELSVHDLHVKQPLDANKLSGWMALARLFKLNSPNIHASLAKWRKLYPYHPANSDFLIEYEKKYKKQQAKLKPRPSMIAVFLPESGRYAPAANVIKTGFKEAYRLAKASGQAKTGIRFYDTTTSSMTQLYRRAVNDGAQLIVGPLDKDNIERLINGNSAELNIPILALNHIDGLSHPFLYQFGLSPIDDAEQIAYKAHRDGYKNALLLVPQTGRGDRVAQYLTRHWEKLGGLVLKAESYDRGEMDFTKTIERLGKSSQHSLSTNDDSDNLDVEVLSPKADVIFIYATPDQGALLNPHLQFSSSTARLPVYATAQIHSGLSGVRDDDLTGITFCDIPWVFERVYAGALTKTALQDVLAEFSPSYLRLLPLGIDAYNLTNQLNHLRNGSYAGATGRLTLTSDNRIMRELFCAKYVNGVPELINYTTESGMPVLQALPPVPEENTPETNQTDSSGQTTMTQTTDKPTATLEVVPAENKTVTPVSTPNIIPGARVPDKQLTPSNIETPNVNGDPLSTQPNVDTQQHF